MRFIKKHIKLIVFIIVCISIYLIYSLSGNKKITYTSLGDGFSTGINSFYDISYGYNDYLKDYLKDNNQLNKYYNKFSYQDMTIKDLQKDIMINVKDNDNNNIKQALRESNLLTISIGINDLIYKMDINKHMSEAKKDKAITEIMESLDKTMIEVKKYYKYDIYLLGYYNFYPQNSVEKELLDKLNYEYKKYSKKNDIIFVDNINMNDKLGSYLDNPNSFYPNVSGYNAIYNNILSKINKK